MESAGAEDTTQGPGHLYPAGHIPLDAGRRYQAQQAGTLENRHRGPAGSAGRRPGRNRYIRRQQRGKMSPDAGLRVCENGAIRKAAEEVFDKQSREFKDIILITDGEEHEGSESFPVQAAEKAAADGIRIIAIGLGNENEGSRIPITGPTGEKTFLKYKGEEIWSRLGGDLLRNIVYVTDGGKYLSVEPGTTLDLGQIYESLIASAEKRELESTTMLKYDEKFQIFVALGLVLLICEAFISERRKI